MSFFNVTEQDLDLIPIVFNAKEVVEFVCLDFNEMKNNTLVMNCRVLSGDHAGKRHSIFIDSRENSFAKKLRVQFLLAFWTKDELQTQTFHPSKLMNRKFSAVAQEPREYEGKIYQSMTGFHDLGVYEGTEASVGAYANGSAESHAAAPRF
jgi:hypothetical protein